MSPNRARSREDGGATGQMVLAVMGFLVLAGFYLEMALIPSAGPLQIILGDLSYCVLILAVLILAAIAYRRSRGAERRLWMFVVAAYAVLVVSEIVWILEIIKTGAVPPPVFAPIQWLHVLAALLFLSVVACLTPLVGTHPLMRTRQILDLASLGIVVYVSAFFLTVTPYFSGISGSDTSDALVGAVYPTWALLILAGLAWPMLSSGGRYVRRGWETALWCALGLYAVAVGLWPLWFAWVISVAGGEQAILDVAQMLSHYLLAFALCSRIRHHDGRWTPPRPLATPTRLARTFNYLMLSVIMLSMPVLIGLAITSPEGSLTRTVLVLSSALLAALTVARTVITAIDSGRLFRRSVTDPLTSLHNHRFFHESLRHSIDVAARFDGQLAVLALDLDDFDEVNNRHGHPAGDELLRRVAAAISNACGRGDIVCRVGGDEFAVVMPGAEPARALDTALRIRSALAAVLTPDGKRITVSTGVACFPQHAEDASALMRLADGASYWVKRHGKDHALLYDAALIAVLGPEDLVRFAEEQAESGIVRALAAAVDARHAYTSTHSVAVAAWSADVARRLGLRPDRIRIVETAALLHDVGMIAVGEDVIAKTGTLDAYEAEVIRAHAPLGERIVAGSVPAEALAVIRHHHENWDGSGYPDGLRAVAIPLEARIVHVCGAYDAMTSPRPYRPAMSVSAAVAELRAGSGTQFDPEVVDVFLEALGLLGRLQPHDLGTQEFS